MSVLRQLNLLGQMRIDVPHLRGIESAVAADFDLLAGQIMAGQVPLVLHGFSVITPTGGAATSLQIDVAGGVLIHPLASENGSIFFAPTNRAVETLNVANARLQGGFTSGAVNYIGLDLRRSADSSTADNAQFLNPDTNLETPKEIPLGRTLDYVLVVSTQDFSATPSLAPLAKITTDANNNVTVIEDARDLFFRLGTGGTVTNPQHAYSWPAGRTEVGNNSEFGAGDKALHSMKDWFDAVMTRLWELGGGERWYSPTADRNVQLTRGYTGVAFSNGEWFEWTGTNLHWKSLKIIFDNSTGYYNDIVDQTVNSAILTNLADGECIYVDIDRSANRTGGTALQPVKAVYRTLGATPIPGSRFILAWRVGSVIWTRDSGWPVGSTFFPATDLALGLVKLSIASDTPAFPVVAVVDANFIAGVRGISRTTLGGNLGSGHLLVGQGTNDTGVDIGKAGATTRIFGLGQVDDRLTVTAVAASNRIGVDATGDGTGTGVKGTGGGNIGIGVWGVGGAGGSIGVRGDGTGSGGIGIKGNGASGGRGGEFVGGANSDGILGTGTGTGKGGAFQGGATGASGVDATGGAAGGAGANLTPGASGSALQANAIAGTDQPIAQFLDENGHRREVVDHRGFVMGRVNRFLWQWDKSQVSVATQIVDDGSAMPERYAQWTLTETGAEGSPQASLWVFDMETQTMCQTGGIKCLGTSSVNHNDAWLSTAFLTPTSANLELVAEWEVTVDNTTDDVEYEIGFANGNALGVAAPTATRWAVFRYRKATNTHWLCEVKNGGGVVGGAATATTVTVVANTYNVMRMEVYGSGTTKFFIDGALVATIAGWPNDNLLFLFGGVLQAGSNKIFRMKTGQIQAKWNRVVAPAAIG